MEKIFRILTALIVAGLFSRCSDEQMEITQSEKIEIERERVVQQSTKASNAFSIEVIDHDDVAPIGFMVSVNEDAKITVDWGDGSTVAYNLSGSFNPVAHDYEVTGTYHVNIIGDLKKIISLFMDCRIRSIQLDNLRNLQEFVGAFSPITTLDLSNNSKLSTLDFTAAPALENLILPKKHNLNFVSLAGNTSLTTQRIDAVIDHIYSHALRHRINGGTFVLNSERYDPRSVAIGPPSAESISKLKILQNDYGWRILPAQ